jgi:lipid-binding SYLF domain-containing protein
MSALIRIIFAGLLAAAPCATGQSAIAQSEEKQQTLTAEEKEAERTARLKLAADGLEKLYKLQPEARQAVQKAAGYAVFDISAIYVILFVGQKGKGVLFDNETKKPTYMLSTRAGTGPGIGKQRVYQIFVFKTKGAMEQFVSAGGTGADVSASVSTGKDGSVRSFNPDIDIYQIPEKGLALQASWGGTIYSVDSQLR